jgi:hypothetical protein
MRGVAIPSLFSLTLLGCTVDSEMITAAGLPGERVEDGGRSCQVYVQFDVPSWMKERYGRCTTLPYPRPIPVARAIIEYDRWTGRIQKITRTWQAADSQVGPSLKTLSGLPIRGAVASCSIAESPALRPSITFMRFKFGGLAVSICGWSPTPTFLVISRGRGFYR